MNRWRQKSRLQNSQRYAAAVSQIDGNGYFSKGSLTSRVQGSIIPSAAEIEAEAASAGIATNFRLVLDQRLQKWRPKKSQRTFEEETTTGVIDNAFRGSSSPVNVSSVIDGAKVRDARVRLDRGFIPVPSFGKKAPAETPDEAATLQTILRLEEERY